MKMSTRHCSFGAFRANTGTTGPYNTGVIVLVLRTVSTGPQNENGSEIKLALFEKAGDQGVTTKRVILQCFWITVTWSSKGLLHRKLARDRATRTLRGGVHIHQCATGKVPRAPHDDAMGKK